MPFRTAHSIVGRIAAGKGEPTMRTLDEISLEILAGASLASIGALWLGFRMTAAAGAILYVAAGLLFRRVGKG